MNSAPSYVPVYRSLQADQGPDFTIKIAEMLSENGVVTTEWTATATHEGGFNDIPPTNREVELQGMSKTEIRDGQIMEDRVYHDFHVFLEQLGLTDG